MASTYLRNGALGFAGSTMMAWVGRSHMGPADWLVQGYLKNVLAGDSLGCALLASKQDYQSHYSLNDDILSSDEQKTLIEYILLGDPSIHPVSSSQSSKALLAFQSRQRRRDARAKLAAGMHECLPSRSDATKAEKDMADRSLYQRSRNNRENRKRRQRETQEVQDQTNRRPSEKSGCAVARFARKPGNRWNSIGVESAIAVGKRSSVC